MIYQFFLISDGKVLVQWDKPGFPKRFQLKEGEIPNKEELKQISTKITPGEEIEGFNTVNFGTLIASIYTKEKTSYVVVSDSSEALKARRKVLKKIVKKMAPNLPELKEGKKLGNLDEVMEDIVSGHTRSLAGVRSSSFSSLVLGFLGGLISLLAFAWIGKYMPPNPTPDMPFTWMLTSEETFLWTLTLEVHNFFPLISADWLQYIIFFGLLTLFIGILVGLISGKGLGGFLGSYISMILIFSLPLLVPELPVVTESIFEEYFPLYRAISQLYEKFLQAEFTASWQVLFTLGISFILFSSIISALVGRFLDKRSLLASQIPSKRKKKPKKEEAVEEVKKEEVRGEVEEEEEVEIEEGELEELEELFEE